MCVVGCDDDVCCVVDVDFVVEYEVVYCCDYWFWIVVYCVECFVVVCVDCYDLFWMCGQFFDVDVCVKVVVFVVYDDYVYVVVFVECVECVGQCLLVVCVECVYWWMGDYQFGDVVCVIDLEWYCVGWLIGCCYFYCFFVMFVMWFVLLLCCVVWLVC